MVSDTAASDEAAHVVSLQKELAETRSLVKKLTDRIARNENYDTIYAASCFASHSHDFNKIPEKGMPAKHVATVIEDVHLCDFNPLLNTSSYVNVTSEAEERKVAAMGAQINIADASVYPATIDLHDRVVNMIANLWHAPEPANGGNFAGAGTVGSTEGCLLAGLALKFRWREWYMKKHGLTSQQVLGVRPNLVIVQSIRQPGKNSSGSLMLKRRLSGPILFTIRWPLTLMISCLSVMRRLLLSLASWVITTMECTIPSGRLIGRLKCSMLKR